MSPQFSPTRADDLSYLDKLSDVWGTCQDDCKDKLKSNRNLSQIYGFIKEMDAFGDANKIVENYLASKFTEIIEEGQEYKYKITIAIAKKLLMGDLLNGILYPSMAVSGNVDNVALKAEYADKNLEFVSVEYIEITDRDGMQIRINTLDSATTTHNDGSFRWSGCSLKWELKKDGDELRMKAEGGGWHAYDKYGNKVDPI